MELRDKLRDTLNEGRILILGSQVILGFQWHAGFEKGYGRLPLSSQYLGLISLGAMLVVFGLLIAPACYHGIVNRGNDSSQLHYFTTVVTETALLPFSIALGCSLFLAASMVIKTVPAILFGTAGTLLALVLWFGIEHLWKERRRMMTNSSDENEPTPLSIKIDHILTEARMVLPGAQALLGFQFIIFFSDEFYTLPEISKIIHLISLFLVALCIILLMSPAAFHRIVEEGENTERFYNVANGFVLMAMVPLGIAAALDFYVIVEKITHSVPIALASAAGVLLFFFGFWFGYTFYVRERSRK